MIAKLRLLLSFLFLLILGIPCAVGQAKELYLPTNVMRVPDGNDYNDPESEFSKERMVESPNLAIFWHKEFGGNPMTNPDSLKRFDVRQALSECERFYNFYVKI
jgi:hypothetical protein